MTLTTPHPDTGTSTKAHDKGPGDHGPGDHGPGDQDPTTADAAHRSRTAPSDSGAETVASKAGPSANRRDRSRRIPPDAMDDHELHAVILDALDRGRRIPPAMALAFEARHRDAVFESFVNIVALPRCRVPHGLPRDRLALLAPYTWEERIAALDEGAEPTALEVRLWRRAFIEHALTNDDADLTSSVNLVPIRDGERRAYAVATVRGYSFSGVEVTWHGFVRDRDQAEALLRRSFYLSGEPAAEQPVLVSDRTGLAVPGEGSGIRPRRRKRGAKGAPSPLRLVK